MKGTNGMLPTMFDYQPRRKQEKVMEAEKPTELIENIIEYISLPKELLLDQFAGSGNFVIACMNTDRNGIAIEKYSSIFEKAKQNIEDNLLNDYSVSYEEFETEIEDEMSEIEL